uniref:hypothetical protein n=1 Tax=Methylogaea oryzae TaxID=1295382 RepID=UPI001C3F46DB
MALIWREATGPLACAWLDTPVGALRLSARGDVLVSIDWDDEARAGEPPSPVLRQACAALQRY